MTPQQRVWNVLEPWGSGSLAARRVGGFVGAVIMLAVVATVAESVKSIHEAYHGWFIAIEVFCLLVFGTEYALRLWAAGCQPRFQGLRGRLRWMVTFWAII